MSMFRATVPQLIKMLRNLDGWLEKATAHAEAKKFSPEVLLAARLAPDQYPLLRQIQSACDSAKFAAARLTAKEAPKHPDEEKTWAEAKARVASVVGYLETFTEADFEGAAERAVALPYLGDKTILGRDYLNEMALPNTYFHLAMAYAILRHSGVDLGKMDFLGSVTLQG